MSLAGVALALPADRRSRIALVVLATIAGRIRPRIGEPLLVIALVIANPTLYVTALCMLVAIVPLWRTRRTEPAAVRLRGRVGRVDDRGASA
jgi:hypothetical protein